MAKHPHLLPLRAHEGYSYMHFILSWFQHCTAGRNNLIIPARPVYQQPEIYACFENSTNRPIPALPKK